MARTPIHPGEILADELEEIVAVAVAIDIPVVPALFPRYGEFFFTNDRFPNYFGAVVFENPLEPNRHYHYLRYKTAL